MGAFLPFNCSLSRGVWVSVTFVYCVETAKGTVTVAMEYE